MTLAAILPRLVPGLMSTMTSPGMIAANVVGGLFTGSKTMGDVGEVFNFVTGGDDSSGFAEAGEILGTMGALRLCTAGPWGIAVGGGVLAVKAIKDIWNGQFMDLFMLGGALNKAVPAVGTRLNAVSSSFVAANGASAASNGMRAIGAEAGRFTAEYVRPLVAGFKQAA